MKFTHFLGLSEFLRRKKEAHRVFERALFMTSELLTAHNCLKHAILPF